MEANRLRHLLPSLLSAPASASASLPPIYPSNLTSSGPFFTSASDSVRCRSRRPDVRKPNWSAAGTERSKFYPYNELYDDDEEDDGGLWENKKQRTWCSDDDEEEDGFWGFKILQVFGWMVPAILISVLLGTGPNALFMAIALPLGQTALSLAVDKVWGMARQTSKSTPRSKPFASTNRARKRKQDAEFVGSKETRSSPSSTDYYEPAQRNTDGASTSFGGWDELDREVEMRPNMEEEERKRQKNSKVSKRVKNRDSFLLIRLLIALFPFLGSWARFL